MKKRKTLSLLIPLMLLSACGNSTDPNPSEETGSGSNASSITIPTTPSDTTRISFKSAASYEFLSTLNGKKVEICGFMATSSPIDGSFIFLMNLPYQNCPFCKPNTNQLSNTMEVYPKKGVTFDYTTQAIKVSGILEVAEQGKYFSDPFGYEFSFKIVNADYKIMKEEEMTSELAIWQRLSSSGLVADIYSMYDYLHFLCNWPIYYIDSYTNSKGEYVAGFYFYPGDALNYIKNDGAQFNYGYKSGYFSNLISRLDKISTTGFEDLKQNINKAKTLAEYALSELEAGHYTYTFRYVEEFGVEDYVFELTDKTLAVRWETLYQEFADWIGSFEM